MKLYIYDHCPFCVRARMIFGIQQIPVEQIILANDDEATPISLIGAKQVPILQKPDGSYMGESLDIVRHINAQAERPISEAIRPEIQAWADKVGEYYNQLLFPRSIQLGLPEFATPSAVVYFIRKKEAQIGTGIAQMLEKTPELLAQIHHDLQTLASRNQHGRHHHFPDAAQSQHGARHPIPANRARLHRQYGRTQPSEHLF